MYSSTLSLTSALGVVGGHSHVPAALPREKTLVPIVLGGWVGPRVGLVGWEDSRPHRDSIPGPSSHSESLYRPCYPSP